MSILLDAGPSLNFLAVSQQCILIHVAESHDLQIAAPERVDREVEGKTRDPRFERTAARGTWRSLKSSGRIQILGDTLTTQEFTDAVSRISGMPAENRIRRSESLGEIMVLAHASVYAQQGNQVFVLMDESDGRRRARREQEWLAKQSGLGQITLWSTLRVLRAAARHQGWIAGGLTWEVVYRRAL